MNKAKQIETAKEIAIKELSEGSTFRAFDTFASELRQHPETSSHPAIRRGMNLLLNDELRSSLEMQDFIMSCT